MTQVKKSSANGGDAMNQNNKYSTEEPPDQALNRKPSRLFFIDNMRGFLAILVVLHHVALVYGASLQGYYYVEPPFTDPVGFVTLLVFGVVNQSWFMGAFFLLAGYFTPGSYNRKGASSFLKDKLLRLGVPVIIFYYVISPISFIGINLMPATLTGITDPLTWQSFWQSYQYRVGIGPQWFCALLLVFDFGYAAVRKLVKNKTPALVSESTPSYLGIFAFTLALAVVSYLIRMVIPLGTSVLGFPTLAYFPQYLSFFVLGAVASSKKWFRTVPDSMGVIGVLAAVIVSALLFPLAISGQMFSLELSPELNNAFGLGHWQSAVYALWDSTFAVGICLGLVTFFRRFSGEQGKLGKFVSQQSYAVYITHIPVVVLCAYALRDIVLGSVLKFGVVSVIVVPTCYVVAYIVRKIPGVSRII